MLYDALPGEARSSHPLGRARSAAPDRGRRLVDPLERQRTQARWGGVTSRRAEEVAALPRAATEYDTGSWSGESLASVWDAVGQRGADHRVKRGA